MLSPGESGSSGIPWALLLLRDWLSDPDGPGSVRSGSRTARGRKEPEGIGAGGAEGGLLLPLAPWSWPLCPGHGYCHPLRAVHAPQGLD